MPSKLFKGWLKKQVTPHSGVSLYIEQPGKRPIGLGELKGLLADHFVGEMTILKAGGYTKAAGIIAKSLPTNKRTRSGDLGELLATEYINSETEFVIPIKKLRWKSDREMPLHGNDVIGINAKAKPIRVMKGECKSRVTFSKAVVDEASIALDRDHGRPNPSTLAFITKRLYEENRDAEANIFRDLQSAGSIPAKNITHMIFVLSGNDPSNHLAGGKSKHSGIKRENAGLMISDHSAFVTAVFKTYGT